MNLDTKFKYILDSEGLLNAEIGLRDLHLSIFPTLVFLPEIKIIKIID
jgi:hypothetical protein